MKNFTHLSYNERRKIYSSLCEGKSKKEIAIMLERTTSSISREVWRNSDAQGYYLYPGEATEFAQKRRHRKKPKIENNKNLRDYIIDKLHWRWFPNSIAGRLNQENKKNRACKESIYLWIYSKDGKCLGVEELLVRAKKKRGAKRKSPCSKIRDRVSIHTRPNNINDCSEWRHYECDLIFNKGSMSKNICTLVERSTR